MHYTVQIFFQANCQQDDKGQHYVVERSDERSGITGGGERAGGGLHTLPVGEVFQAGDGAVVLVGTRPVARLARARVVRP